jgi:hypothetical protein
VLNVTQHEGESVDFTWQTHGGDRVEGHRQGEREWLDLNLFLIKFLEPGLRFFLENPPARPHQNMWRTRRPSFCDTSRLFRGSAEKSSTENLHFKPYITKKLTVREALFRGECVVVNACMHDKHWDQAVTLPDASGTGIKPKPCTWTDPLGF